VLPCALALVAFMASLACMACGRSEASRDDERPRLRSSPGSEESASSSSSSGATTASSATAQKPNGIEANGNEVPKAKDVCNKLGDALKKEGKTKWKKIGKRVQSCIRKAALLEKEDAALYACVARCAIKAEEIGDFDKCDQQCDQSGKKNVTHDDE